VSFVGLLGAELLKKVPEIAASTGAACHAGHAAPSHVLRAMGMPSKLIRGAVRISVGRYTTIEEIDQAADAILKAAPPAK
jgi:cysteine desulfurase